MANNQDNNYNDLDGGYSSQSEQDYGHDNTQDQYQNSDQYYDDLDDQSQSLDDGEWDDQGIDESEPLNPPEDRKKKSLLLLGVIAIVILGGGAFAFTKLVRQPPVPTPQPEDFAAQTISVGEQGAQPGVLNPTAPPQPQPINAGTDQSGGPLLPEPPADDAANDAASKDLPVPNEPGNEIKVAAPQGKAQPVIADAVKSDGAKPLVPFQPTSDFPSVNDIKKPDEPKVALNNAQPLDKVPTQAVTAEPLKDMAPVPTPVSSTPVSAGTSDELAQSKRTIETLTSELDAQKKAAQESRSQVEDLKNQIASLQADLVRANEKKSTPSPAAAPVAAPSKSSASEGKKTAAASTERTKKSAAGSRPKPQISESQDRSTTRVVASNKWVLKGAQSGQAILGSLGHDDLRTVTVGETVSGLGRITSIERTGSGWVVQGTSGSVSQ